MNKSIVVMMAVSGLVLGFFVALSREPIAGAVVGGLVSVLTAVGLFFLQVKDGVANNSALARPLSWAMMAFCLALLAGAVGFTLAAPVLPSNLETKRDVIERLLDESGLTEVAIGDTQKFQIPAQKRQAATALLLASDTLSGDASWLRTFGFGTAPSASKGSYAGMAYCEMLAEAKKTSPTDPGKLQQLAASTSVRSARVAARLALAITDLTKLAGAIEELEGEFCDASGEVAVK